MLHEKPLLEVEVWAARHWFGAGVAAVLMLGVLGGMSAFTFSYADGLSYFSTDPRACANCHIMQTQYDSWQHSSHHAVAACVDCHLPHDFIGKYIAKAENGYHHSRGFTLQDFHEPIMIKEKNAAILQHNCVACHEELTRDIAGGQGPHAQAISCVHCHAGVGHGERTGIGGPDRGLLAEEANP